MFKRRRWTRFPADKCSFRSAGNGMHSNQSVFRLGADPGKFKNESGRIGSGVLFPEGRSTRDVSVRNGCCIAEVKRCNKAFGTPQRVMQRTRSGCSRAAMMLSAPSTRDLGSPLFHMIMGNAGQISSISLTSLFSVQRSCRCRRRGLEKMTCRHLRHTCTRVCHCSVSWASST